jgi:uncharacterized protein
VQDLRNFTEPVWQAAEKLYACQNNRDMPFHGWHHVTFVTKKAKDFAEELGADVAAVTIAALLHDVNYLVAARGNASLGRSLRARLLREAGLDEDSIYLIEEIVLSSETRSRGRDISREAMALSDADTLFKALPITPVILAPLYMRETGQSMSELAQKIVGEQVPLSDDGIYFYSESAKKKYEDWGEVNLTLWVRIRDALTDPSVVELIGQVQQYTMISAGIPA